MGDEDQSFSEGLAGEDQDFAGEEKSGGLLAGALLKVLKYVAMAVGAIIFIVTVVIITNRILDRGGESITYVQQVSPEYSSKPEELSWYQNIEEIRGRTADRNPVTVIASVALGYEKENKVIQTELISRTPRLRDMIRSFFSQKTAAELQPQYEEELKVELKEKINSILTQGQIREVIFLEFNVVEF
jgi:flagellar FliL protein